MARSKVEIKNMRKFRKVMKNYNDGLLSISDASKLLGMSRTTFYRRMKELEALHDELSEECEDDEE